MRLAVDYADFPADFMANDCDMSDSDQGNWQTSSHNATDAPSDDSLDEAAFNATCAEMGESHQRHNMHTNVTCIHVTKHAYPALLPYCTTTLSLTLVSPPCC